MSVLLKTVSLVLRNWHYYLLFCALDVALTGFGVVAISQWNLALSMSLTGATSLLWLVFTFFVLRASVLQGQPAISGPDGKKALGKFLPFVAKSLALYLISFAICAPIFFAFAKQAPFVFLPDSATSGTVPGFVLVFFAGATIIFSAVLALLGTWLPATMYGVNPLFSQAAPRGMHTFRRSFFRIAAILIVFPLISWGVSAVTVPSSPIFLAGFFGTATISMGLEAALDYIIDAIFITLIMVALSENYFEGEKLLQAVPAMASQQ